MPVDGRGHIQMIGELYFYQITLCHMERWGGVAKRPSLGRRTRTQAYGLCRRRDIEMVDFSSDCGACVIVHSMHGHPRYHTHIGSGHVHRNDWWKNGSLLTSDGGRDNKSDGC